MATFFRSILALFLGALTAMVLIGVIETAGHQVFPPPPDLDLSDSTAMEAILASMPLPAFLFILLAWGVGSLGGAWVAARLSTVASMVHGLAIGALLLTFAIATMVMLPHPLWFCAAAVLTIPASAWLGAHVGSTRRYPEVKSM